MFCNIILLLTLNLISTQIKSDFIEENFSLFSKRICSTNQVNILLSDSFSESLLFSNWRYFDCNYILLDDKEFDKRFFKRLDIFQTKNLNFIIEYINEKLLAKVIKFLYSSVNSKLINIFIVIKNNSIREYSSNIFQTYVHFRCVVIHVQNNRNASDIAYIRPVINGCQEYEGILYSNEAKVKDMLTVKPLKCNLNGTLLRVVVNEALPYCKVLFKDDKYILDESVEALMIYALAKKFNFRYEVLYANQSWGTEENGVWAGSVGHVFNKMADIAICDLTKSLKRMQVIDYTDAYSIVPLTFVTLRPGLKSRKWITITPFSELIWSLMIIAFVVISVLIQIFYFNKYQNTYSRNGFNRMSGISIALIGALLQQSNIKLIGNTFRIRVLFCLWFLSSLILMKTYGGVFYSVLTIPVFERPIETLADLERVVINRENDIFTYRHSYYFDYFAKAECCDAYHTIGQSLIESKLDMPSNLKGGIEAVEMSRYLAKSKILIMTYQALAFGIRSFASIDMYLSTDALMIDQLAMAVQKGSPILNSMNEAIIMFIENGLFIKWMSQTLLHIPAKLHSDEDTTKKIKTLELIDLQSIFYISFIGIFISNVLIIFELLMKSKINYKMISLKLFSNINISLIYYRFLNEMKNRYEFN